MRNNVYSVSHEMVQIKALQVRKEKLYQYARFYSKQGMDSSLYEERQAVLREGSLHQ
jgi:hypothetical protein